MARDRDAATLEPVGMVDIVRLSLADVALARATFAMMAIVFDENSAAVGDDYVRRLLSRDGFIAIAAVSDGRPVGGITAHVLPMTRSETSEVFIYDIAVRPDQQRRGVGRRLMSALQEHARSLGIDDLFVPADNEDAHALEFYRALGGAPGAVTIFSFRGSE